MDPARDACTVSATQIGKSFALACWILSRAWEDSVKRNPWWWVAPTYGQAVIGFRLVLALAASAGVVRGNPITAPPQSLQLLNGSRIEFRSWEREQNLQGTTIAGAVVDEAGLLSPEAQAAISARRSATLGPVRYIGNPGIVAGPFRRLCSLGEQAAVSGSEWAGVYSLHRWTWRDKHAALLSVDPHRAAEYERFIAQERTSLPDFEFRRLYEAEWTEDEAAVFRAVKEPYGPPAPEPNCETYVFGVDVAQESDYLVALGIGLQTRRACVMDRWRGIPYPQSADRLQALSQRWGRATLVIETNGPGLPLFQELAQRGVPVLPFTTTGPSKQEIITQLAAELEHGRLTLADLPPLHAELKGYRYERMPSGHYRYGAPPGEHDDCVMALAFGNWGLSRVVNLADYGWLS